MKKMIIIIIILTMILTGMIWYRSTKIGSKNNINVKEIENIENYISKLYLWKEVTNEALPSFEDINQADDLWIWEVVKKNFEDYEMTYEDIEMKTKEIFGNGFNKEFPKEGNQSLLYDDKNKKYLATETILDEREDMFFLNNIEKNKEGYVVEIIEYLEDYMQENKIVIRNLQEDEIGQVSASESEIKIREIVKNNIERFSKKKIYLKKENNKLIIQRVEKVQE